MSVTQLPGSIKNLDTYINGIKVKLLWVLLHLITQFSVVTQLKFLEKAIQIKLMG